MRAIDVIIKKRDGGELTAEEIQLFIEGYTQGDIPDYQAAAWCMAILLRGMTHREASDLTLAMAGSGDTLDLHSIAPFVVDKHSTGGVGDKTTLAVAPLVASHVEFFGRHTRQTREHPRLHRHPRQGAVYAPTGRARHRRRWTIG